MAYRANGRYRILCRDDAAPDGTPGKYVPATSRDFDQADKAIDFARTIAESREPLVVQVIWDNGPLE